MEKEFVPYNLALKLKELGFDEVCLAFYDGTKAFTYSSNNNKIYAVKILAPLWQQAFDWFREKHNYNVEIIYNSFSNDWLFIYYKFNEARINREVFYNFISYEEARQACLEKLIELIENKIE